MKKIYCNMCGRKMAHDQEEYLFVQKEWGYFSKRDQKGYRFYLCENCFQNLTDRFQVPAEVYEQKELL